MDDPPKPPRLLDRVREAIRVRQYSIRTEEAYVHWARRFILFHNKKHPAAMGADEVNAFLTHLAAEAHVSSSTQNQALSAISSIQNQALSASGFRCQAHPRRRPAIILRGRTLRATKSPCRNAAGSPAGAYFRSGVRGDLAARPSC